MSHVTNRVGVEALRELLEEARFPVLAHVDGSEVVQTFPVASRWNESRFLVGLASGAFQSGTRVALAVDRGWF